MDLEVPMSAADSYRAHKRIVRAVEDSTIDLISRALGNLADVEVWGNLIGCANGVSAHVDPAGIFDPWSAFYVVHNDSCIVWGHEPKARFCPMEGERFELNINKRHGVLALRHANQVFVAVHADGKSRREARKKLTGLLRSYASTATGDRS